MSFHHNRFVVLFCSSSKERYHEKHPYLFTLWGLRNIAYFIIVWSGTSLKQGIYIYISSPTPLRALRRFLEDRYGQNNHLQTKMECSKSNQIFPLIQLLATGLALVFFFLLKAFPVPGCVAADHPTARYFWILHTVVFIYRSVN